MGVNKRGTRMNKELNALEHLMNCVCYKCESNDCEKGNFNCRLFKLYSEVRDALIKELIEYRKCIDLKEAHFISTHNMSVIDTETFNQLVKNSQALEIIKDKDVNPIDIRCCDTVEQYNVKENGNIPLTKEEFDILKEVLL